MSRYPNHPADETKYKNAMVVSNIFKILAFFISLFMYHYNESINMNLWITLSYIKNSYKNCSNLDVIPIYFGLNAVLLAALFSSGLNSLMFGQNLALKLTYAVWWKRVLTFGEVKVHRIHFIRDCNNILRNLKSEISSRIKFLNELFQISKINSSFCLKKSGSKERNI